MAGGLRIQWRRLSDLLVTTRDAWRSCRKGQDQSYPSGVFTEPYFATGSEMFSTTVQ